MSTTLSYRSLSPQLPKQQSEYAHAYQAERGRWLRRRFLAYVGLNILLSLPWLLPGCRSMGGASTSDSIGLFLDVSLVLFLLMYGIGFAWAWRAKPKYESMMRAARLLFLVGGAYMVLMSVGYLRPTVEMGIAMGLQNAPNPKIKIASTDARPPALTFEDFNEGDAAPPIFLPRSITDNSISAERRPSLAVDPLRESPRTTPKPKSPVEPIVINFGNDTLDPSKPLNATWNRRLTTITQVGTWVMLAFMLFLNHLFICIFIPWTVRESLLPSLLILVLAAAVIVADTLIAAVPGVLVASSFGLLGLSIIPGTFLNWLRFSRFNSRFKLSYESSRFQQITREMEGARQIHEAALPPPLRDGLILVEYAYEPMREIGGDMLFIHRPSPGVVHAVIFDVTGHGVAAALTVNRLLGEIERTFAEHPNASPEQLIRNLNTYAYATLSRHAVFVTAIAVRIDAADGQVEFVSAGHPTAFHLRIDRLTRKIESTAMLLGAVGNDLFDVEVARFQILPGEALILYTDGASEAANDDGQMLRIAGVEQLCRDISRSNPSHAAWPAMILDRVRHYRSGPPQDDTLIVSLYRA
jgi:hypothetical protein